MLEPVLGGEVILPVGDVPEPFVAADHIAEVADGVQRTLGRRPRDFADYATDTAATGIRDKE